MNAASSGRIVVATPVFGATSETFITRHAQGLGAVVIAESLGPDASGAGVEVVDLSAAVAASAAPLPRIALSLRKAVLRLTGGDTHILPRRLADACSDTLARIRPSIVLAEYGNHALNLRPVCRGLGIPLVAHFHGYDLSSLYRHAGYRRALEDFIPEAAGFVVVNSIQRERLIALGCPPEKIGLIPYGVPVEAFMPGGRVGEVPCAFIAVGRMVEKKSPLNTIRAFAQCRASCAGATLMMIGDGPLLATARAFAAELLLGDSITFTGALPNDEVKRRLAAAQVFIQHSSTSLEGDEEGWPVAVAEAAACGLPVIATRHAGIPDEVIDKKTGLLVEEHAWEAMGKAMITLAEDPARRVAMGAAARSHIEEVGDLKKQVARLREFLERAGTAP